MIAENLPAIVILTPLFGALISIFVGSGTKAWAWAMFVVSITFVLSLMMIGQLQASGEAISYTMGRWPPEWGIEFRLDHLNAMVLLIITSIGLVTTFYARLSIAKELCSDRLHIFYSIWLLSLMGMMGMTLTGDAFNVYVMLEISALTVYTLIALGKSMDRRALIAAIRYLVLGTIGATFILVGIGYLLMVTGTLNMADMHAQLTARKDFVSDGGIDTNRTILVAFAFLLVGIGVKAALFPLHMWLPNAYTYAPSAVSAMLAATATKVGVYIGIRFLLTIFGYDFSFLSLPSHQILIFCSGMAIVICSLQAIRQTNIKKLLAYSSVAQIGYMVLGFALHNQAGITGSVLHLFNHAMTKGGMFLALGAVVYRLGGADLEQLRGLGRKMPWTMAALTAGGFGLIGFPLTSGFVSKFYLIQGCLDAGNILMAAVVLFGSLLAVIYVWKIIEAVYFQESTGPSVDAKEAPVSMVIATWVLIGASIYFGIDATFTAGLAESAAVELLPAAVTDAPAPVVEATGGQP